MISKVCSYFCAGAFIAFSLSANADLITPGSATLEASSEFFPAANIANDSGLSGAADEGNYTTITHAAASGSTAWTTDAPGGGAADYFALDRGLAPLPVFTLSLDTVYRLTDLVFWGYHFNNPNGNESKTFMLEFSQDGGGTYPQMVTVSSPAITQGIATTMSFGGDFFANQIRMTVTDNWFENAGGGDRAGIGEVKFLGQVASDPFLDAPSEVVIESDGTVENVMIDIANGGATQVLLIDQLLTGGTDAGKISGITFPDMLDPGEAGEIAFAFDPGGVAGPISAELIVDTNDPALDETVIAITGAVRNPWAKFPDQLEFVLGPLPSNAGTQMVSAQVENLGSTASLNLTPQAFMGPHASHFSVSANPSPLPAGGMGDLVVNFDPQGRDGIFRAQLPVSTDDFALPSVTLSFLVNLEVAEPLVAWWPLDVDGTDATGNGHDGTPIGNPVTAAGANSRTGGSIDFDGATRFDVPFSPDLNPESFTVTLWANADAAAGAFHSPITSRDDFQGGVETHGYIIYNDSDGNWNFWTGNGNPGWDTLPGSPVVVGQWTHVAIVYDSLANSKTLYIDGVAVNVDDAPGPPQYSPNGTTEQDPLHIGAGQDDGLAFWFDGRIDDIGMFRDALSSDDIVLIRDHGVVAFANPIPPFNITEIRRLPNGHVELTFESEQGTVYEVERSADLLEWDTLPEIPIGGEGETTIFTDTNPLPDEPHVFYRVINTGEQD